MIGKLKALRFAMVLVATALFGGSALAATAEPASDGQQIAALVAQTTDMPAGQIAIAGPQNVYSVEPLGMPTATGQVIARVRTEAVDADWSATHKFKSWEAHALFDCAGKRVRIVRSATYAEANLKGEAKVDDLGGSWFTPQAAEPAAVLLAAACDRNFAWPLRVAAAPQTAAPAKTKNNEAPRPAATPDAAPASPPQRTPSPPAAEPGQTVVAVASPPAGEAAASVQKASVAVAAQEPIAAQVAQPTRRALLVAAPTSAVAAVKRWASAGESFVGRRASSVRRWFASRQPAPGELRQAAL